MSKGYWVMVPGGGRPVFIPATAIIFTDKEAEDEVSSTPMERAEAAAERIKWTGKLSIDQIRMVVGAYYNIPREEMCGPRRHQVIARPRMVAMTLVREHTNLSLPRIGAHFGRRDHTTVIHAMERVRQLRASHPKIEQDINAIQSVLFSIKARPARKHSVNAEAHAPEMVTA